MSCYVASTIPNRTPAERRYVDYLRESGRGIGWVDSRPVREHVLMLGRAGHSLSYVARAAGVTITTVAGIRDGRYSGCNHRVAATVMRVSYAPGPGQVRVGALSARRRVHALACLGWTSRHVAAELGITAATLSRSLCGDTMHYQRWQAISDVYDALHMTPGPSQRARGRGRSEGWLPPLAWDDIDDPDETPRRGLHDPRSVVDPIAVQRALSGDRTVCLSSAEKRVAIQHALDRGWSYRLLADRLGITHATADQMMVRARRRVAA